VFSTVGLKKLWCYRLGCAVGSSTLFWSFPFAESVFGTIGMQVAVLFGLASVFSG
jgi:hypothetical protein